jgi:hypothetical protein
MKEGGFVCGLGREKELRTSTERGCAAPREFTSATPYCICLCRAFSCAGVVFYHHYGY